MSYRWSRRLFGCSYLQYLGEMALIVRRGLCGSRGGCTRPTCPLVVAASQAHVVPTILLDQDHLHALGFTSVLLVLLMFSL